VQGFNRVKLHCFEGKKKSREDAHERENHKQDGHHTHRRVQKYVALMIGLKAKS